VFFLAEHGSARIETFRNKPLVLPAKIRRIEIAWRLRSRDVFTSRHAKFFQLNDSLPAYACG
jgi:hypothetical protein